MRTVIPTVALLGLAALGACSGPAEPAPSPDTNPSDPPGIAQALSLAGKVEDQGDKSDYERAIDCAVALRITATTLVPLTSGEQSREVRMINATRDIFVSRAQSAQGREGSNVSQDVARGVKEKTGDGSGQAQLAMGCIKSLS